MHKKFLIQAAACNLALLMRSRYGSGKPRAAHDGAIEAILTIFTVIKALKTSLHHDPRTPTAWFEFLAHQRLLSGFFRRLENGRFRHGLGSNFGLLIA